MATVDAAVPDTIVAGIAAVAIALKDVSIGACGVHGFVTAELALDGITDAVGRSASSLYEKDASNLMNMLIEVKTTYGVEVALLDSSGMYAGSSDESEGV